MSSHLRRSTISVSSTLRVALVGIAIMLLRADVPTQTATPYGIADLGTFGGASAAAFDVNEYGSGIVGQAQTSSGANHAFVIRYGHPEPEDIGTLGGAESTAFAFAWDAVSGSSQTASGQEHAFSYGLFPDTGMKDLGTLGGTWSAAYGADYQIIVGASKTAGDARTRAFSYTNGTMSALAFDWGGDSVARDVTGELTVGYACTSGNASCHAFSLRSSNGTVTDLGSFGGNSVANSVNYAEQIAGTAALANQTTKHAFLYSNGVMTDLGTLGGTTSEAFDLNLGGDVVGSSQASGGAARAFLWRNGVMTDLNTMIPPGSGWVLQSARGISDGRQIVGNGTLNGVPRAFLLTPPTDLNLSPFGTASQEDGNLPRGVEVGKNIRFVTGINSFTDGGVTVYGARLTATITGPAEIVSWSSYNGNDSCQIAPKVLTCDIGPLDTTGIGTDIFVSVKTTGPGAISNHTVLTSKTDPNTANNAVTIDNWAVALSALTLTPPTIAGGKASSATVTLTDIAPYSNDATVRLSSSRPDVAPVPATIIVPNFSGSTSRNFNIIPKVVSAPTTVDITASYGQVTVTRTLTVMPPALSTLSLTPTTLVGGCGTSAGKIALSGNAPPGGTVIRVTNTNAKANVPASITVQEGASTATFTMTTSSVTTPATGKVTASYGGVSKTLDLTVRPIRASTLTLSPNPATGGSTVKGSVALECAATAGGVVVSLASSNTAVATPTASSVTVPAGATTASFSVRTTRPSASTSLSINATVYGVRKSTTLTVKP